MIYASQVFFNSLAVVSITATLVWIWKIYKLTRDKSVLIAMIGFTLSLVLKASDLYSVVTRNDIVPERELFSFVWTLLGLSFWGLCRAVERVLKPKTKRKR